MGQKSIRYNGKTCSLNHDWRGDAKSDRTFSAPSLYFFSFLLFIFSGSSVVAVVDGGGGFFDVLDVTDPSKTVESTLGD